MCVLFLPDLEWSAPRTTLDSDNLPVPTVNFAPTPAKSLSNFGPQGEGQVHLGPSGMEAQNYAANRGVGPPSTMPPNMGIAVSSVLTEIVAFPYLEEAKGVSTLEPLYCGYLRNSRGLQLEGSLHLGGWIRGVPASRGLG